MPLHLLCICLRSSPYTVPFGFTTADVSSSLTTAMSVHTAQSALEPSLCIICAKRRSQPCQQPNLGPQYRSCCCPRLFEKCCFELRCLLAASYLSHMVITLVKAASNSDQMRARSSALCRPSDAAFFVARGGGMMAHSRPHTLAAEFSQLGAEHQKNTPNAPQSEEPNA